MLLFADDILADPMKSYGKGKLSGGVVHSATEHKREHILDDLLLQDFLPIDWAGASIGQGGSHDCQCLTVQFQRASLSIQIVLQILHGHSFMQM